ncbi:MAG: tetratricopeptide repeat protein [bacterium]
MSARRLLLVATILLAVALRVVYFREIRSSPFFEHPIFDARDYAAWAGEIAHGELLWKEPRLYPPGYPYFLALLSVLTNHSLPFMTYANALLGVGWIVLLVLATRRLLPSPTAELAGLVAASYWVFFHFEAHLVAETWFIFLDVLALYLLAVLADRREPRTERRASVLALAAGVTLGLASVTRPNALASFPFLLLLVALPRGGTSRTALRDAASQTALGIAALRRALPFALGFALVLAPVLLRNHQITGMWAVRHHLAFNLYLGNRPGAPGYHSIRPGRAWDRLSAEPERVAGAHTLADHERYFRDRVISFARNDPGAFLRLQLRKVLLFLNVREIRDIMSPYFFDRFAPLQASRLLPDFGWVGPPALVGLFLALRATPVPWLLFAFALPQAATVVATVIGTRYRLPVVPFLLPFAAYTLVQLAGWLTRRRFAPAIATFAALGVAAAIVHHRFPDLEHDTFAEEMTRVAFVREEEGDRAGAADWWTQALAADPARADTWVGWVDFTLRAGDLARADAATRDALARFPDDADLWAQRGRTLLYLDQPDSARTALETALAKQPDHVDALADLARAQYDLGQIDASVETFRRAVRLDVKRTDVLLDAARVLFEAANRSGNAEERRVATGLVEQVLQRDPTDEDAQALLRAEAPPR